MESRTRTETITFRHPFRLTSHPGLMPAGRYTMVVEEEMVDGLSFAAWRRMGTTITPQGVPAGRLLQSWPVVATELDAALATDARAAS